MTKKLLDIDLERAVWTYRRDGIDYGPFSSGEIIEQLNEDELSRSDVLLEHSTNKVLRIEEVPDFLPALEASEKRRFEQKLDRETKRSFSEIRREQRQKPLLIIASLVLVGVAGWFFFARMSGSNTPGSVAYALVPVTPDAQIEFAAFAPPPKPKSENLAKSEATEKPKKSTKRRNKSQTGNVRPQQAAPVPVVTTIDFSDPEIMNDSDSEDDGPAPLGHSEFQRYRAELQPKLLNCIRNHNQSLNNGSYRLEFKIQRDGTASPAKLRPSSTGSEDLTYCVNSLLRMNKLRAFSGAPRDLSLTFQVAP